VPVTAEHNLNHSVESPSHCVFRRGSSWLALPAVAVREVLPRPQTVFVPGSSAMFVGLCHVRSEFIPVLSLDMIPGQSSEHSDPIMLILDDSDGPWALLVDEVSSLQTLEISDAPEQSASVVTGWATVNDTVVQVLDQAGIRMLAERELATLWEDATAGGRTGGPGLAAARLSEQRGMA